MKKQPYTIAAVLGAFASIVGPSAEATVGRRGEAADWHTTPGSNCFLVDHNDGGVTTQSWYNGGIIYNFSGDDRLAICPIDVAKYTNVYNLTIMQMSDGYNSCWRCYNLATGGDSGTYCYSQDSQTCTGNLCADSWNTFFANYDGLSVQCILPNNGYIVDVYEKY
jgi:hypothetical protein